MDELYLYLSLGQKRLDKRLPTYISSRKEDFVKPETTRVLGSPERSLTAHNLLLVSKTLYYHTSICFTETSRAGSSSSGRSPVYSGLSILYGKQANFCAGAR